MVSRQALAGLIHARPCSATEEPQHEARPIAEHFPFKTGDKGCSNGFFYKLLAWTLVLILETFH